MYSLDVETPSITSQTVDVNCSLQCQLSDSFAAPCISEESPNPSNPHQTGQMGVSRPLFLGVGVLLSEVDPSNQPASVSGSTFGPSGTNGTFWPGPDLPSSPIAGPKGRQQGPWGSLSPSDPSSVWLSLHSDPDRTRKRGGTEATADLCSHVARAARARSQHQVPRFFLQAFGEPCPCDTVSCEVPSSNKERRQGEARGIPPLALSSRPLGRMAEALHRGQLALVGVNAMEAPCWSPLKPSTDEPLVSQLSAPRCLRLM